jgi:hypothetical protein
MPSAGGIHFCLGPCWRARNERGIEALLFAGHIALVEEKIGLLA